MHGGGGKTHVWTMTFSHGSSHVWIGVQIWTKIRLCEKVTTVLLDAGGRGSRRVSVGGEEGVSHISVAPKPASREDFDRFFVSISERFWHLGTSNFDIRAISVIDDFSVWVKKNLVTNKVFTCWDEDLHCFLDRISQASVRFWEWKGNSKEADETKKN